MVVDALRRLRAFSPLPDYHFVGFGAYEFVDFDLCRRELGIVSMHSIEKNTNAQERYTANRPFNEITMHFDAASNVLPDLLEEPVLRVVWLDYTSGLTTEVLQDVGTCLRKLLPGSALIVTVAASPGRPAEQRRAALVAAVGSERVDASVTDESLAHGLPATQKGILDDEVKRQIARRDDGAFWAPIFNIKYRDDQPMQTWGGVVVAPGQQAALEGAAFGELEQTSIDGTVIDATVEPLTTREVLGLNPQLPAAPGAQLVAEGLTDEELQAYQRLYRWYPPVPAAM